ncbi:septum formation family protein [Salinibacterium soli]|uniref:Septum formation family protein n=1 Tax=Antiquaquibacter soli TaxID=3064523 RepID=A0ABT9BK80_9MICO|nr:septum formation family protein [Protaetiibacter sp. WY-16]MDO7881433.1 septum formation family protein [Protaetiibacter sp. WY-16]
MTITSDKVWTRTLAALTVGAAAVVLSGCSLLGNVTNTPIDVDPSDGTDTDVFTIKVGDCLNDGTATGEVSTVPTIDCAEPHDSEAYASIMIPDGDYPGEDAVLDQANTDCEAEFAGYVGIAYEESTLGYAYYYPTEESWASGDREILCLVYDPAGQVEGSLAGTAR